MALDILLCTTASSLHFLYVKKFFYYYRGLKLKKLLEKMVLKKIHSDLKSKKDVLKNGNIYYMMDEEKKRGGVFL